MAKNKFKFTTTEGEVATRSSDRVYTHVVTARLDLVAGRAAIESDTGSGETWDYTKRMAAIEVGQKMWADKPYPMSQDDSDKYKAFMAANPDRAAYVELVKQRHLADYAKRYGAGSKSQELVLQWSMSEANARKGANGRNYYIDVQVKPVDPAPAKATA
jgi:hypothetical protein